MNLSRFAGKAPMAHYTLMARVNAGNGKFPFGKVLFSKNHRPIPIDGATYYLRPSNSGSRTPIRMGKDIAVAHTALVNMGHGQLCKRPDVVGTDPPLRLAATMPRKTLVAAAREYIERSKQESRKTYLGYRTAVNLRDSRSPPSKTRFSLKSWHLPT